MVHQAARHRASGGGLRMPVRGWIVLGVMLVALSAIGVSLAL